MGERKQLHLGREQRGNLFEFESPIITNWDKTEPRAGSLGQQLPRHKVAVVLHHRQENYVAFPNKFSAPCLRYEINALSRSTGEHDLICPRRTDVFCNAVPRFFVSFGRARAQRVRSEEHTSELQSRPHLVCRLLLE